MKNWLDDIGLNHYEDDHHEVFKNIEDNDQDWHIQRLGKITGSNFGKLVVSDRKGGYKLSTGLVAEGLIYKIAWERLLSEGNISNGLGRMSVSSKAMEHGNEYEGQAILEFEKQTGLKVDYSQKFIELDGFIGGTPDGFIGDNALIEIKAPWNGGNHLKSFLTGEIYNPDHFYQIQGYLWITGRDMCFYCTYDPDIMEGFRLSIIEVPRDENVINAIAEIMDQVKEKIKSIINHDKLK